MTWLAGIGWVRVEESMQDTGDSVLDSTVLRVGWSGQSLELRVLDDVLEEAVHIDGL